MSTHKSPQRKLQPAGMLIHLMKSHLSLPTSPAIHIFVSITQRLDLNFSIKVFAAATSAYFPTLQWFV